jgi:DNA invertase Pin-like site-specific DNA recombinase
MTRAVGYYRVSTEFQRETGYSLDGQQAMVRRYISERGMTLVGEFQEAESAYRSGKVTLETRPALEAALRVCKRQKATLVIAALDRLARNVVFVATLVETRVPFVALDIPDATPFMIHIYAAVAEEESRQKGRLVSATLALARARGVPTSQAKRAAAARKHAEANRALVAEIREKGIRGALPIMKELNRRGVPCPSGRRWLRGRVARMLRYLGCYERAGAPCNKIEAETRARELFPLIARRRRGGRTMTEIAAELNKEGRRTGRGQLWTGPRLWNFVKSRSRRDHPAAKGQFGEPT